jgi:hypothetical protein
MSGSSDPSCPLSLWCLQCCCWHSVVCRTYWVCLQHRATVVTSNGVTVCAANFHLPSVSTANTNTVQYPTPHQQYETPTIPAVVMSKCYFLSPTSRQPLVHSRSNLFSDVSPGLPTYNSHNVTKFTVVFLRAIICFPTRTLAWCVQI